MEGAVEGHAALAVNRDHGDGGFTDAAALAAEVAMAMLAAPASYRGRVLNLNIPAGPRAQWRPLRQAIHGHSGFREGYKPVRDARNHIAWRLAGEWVAAPDDGDSDAHLLSAGHPVATMLAPDLNGDQRPLQPLIERLVGAAEPNR
jgi:broad specificity polyphosphatase/5'/3'-nucleotidase SurE